MGKRESNHLPQIMSLLSGWLGLSDRDVDRRAVAATRKKPTNNLPSAAIAQLGGRQTEDLKVPGSIPGLGI